MRRKKLKVIRTVSREKIHDKTYYKVEAELNPDTRTITFETSEYSWGHSDWEDMDVVSYPYNTSSTYGSNPYIACFKTEKKNGIPDDVESLLLEAILKNAEDHVSSLEAKLRRVTQSRDKHKEILDMLSSEPLVLGKKLGIL